MQISFKKYNKGMTLVELMVVLSIFAVISMTVAFNYGSYKSTTSTSVLSQNVALSIREAQGYAMGVKSVSVSGGNVFPGYGVHFDVATFGVVTGSQKSFILFADIPPNATTSANFEYDQPSGSAPDEVACNDTTIGPGNECISINTITGGDKILGVCADTECDQNIANIIGSLDIIFHRPNPDATFCYRSSPGVGCTPGVSSAGVIVQSESDPNISKKIIVWNTGQISVK